MSDKIDNDKTEILGEDKVEGKSVRRSSFHDLGVMLSLSFLVILTIYGLMFEWTIAIVAWLVVTLLYIILRMLKPSYRTKTVMTLSYIICSLAAIFSMAYFDRNIRPNLPSYAGRGELDSLQKKNVVKVESLYPDTLDEDSIEEEDVTVVDTVSFRELEIKDAVNTETNASQSSQASTVANPDGNVQTTDSTNKK